VRSLVISPEASQQLGADRMEQVVVVEVELVDGGQRGRRSCDLRDRGRPVEGDDGRGQVEEELVRSPIPALLK